MMIRALLPLCLAAAAACAGGIAPGERPGTPDLEAFGCYASMAGWLSFGDPESADTVVRSWLILDLRPARSFDSIYVARFLGWHAGGRYLGTQEPRIGFWKFEGDSINVWWHDGFHGVDMHVTQESGGLIGRAYNTTDMMERDSTGKMTAVSYTDPVRAERVPCGQVPARLERQTRNQEPFLGMPIIEPR